MPRRQFELKYILYTQYSVQNSAHSKLPQMSKEKESSAEENYLDMPWTSKYVSLSLCQSTLLPSEQQTESVT